MCTKLKYGTNLDCFCNGIEFTRSHRSEEVIPDPYDKCEAGLRSPFCVILEEQIQLTCNVSIKILCVAENYAFLDS